MNVKLLRKVKKHILAEPKRFRMSKWLETGEPGEAKEEWGTLHRRNRWGELAKYQIAPCGTVGCIAGWTCVLAKADTSHIRGSAKDLLGIDDFAAERLFDLDDWPHKFRKKYLNRVTNAAHAKIAAERIEHFISTKGAE